MSSRSKGKAKASGSGSTKYPTRWSNWEWNAVHNCEVRYRLKSASPNDYEYEYGPVSTDVPRTPAAPSNILEPIPEQLPSTDNYYTGASSNTVDNLTRDFAATSFSPTGNQQPQISQSFASPPPSAFPRHITTRDGRTLEEPFDPNYKVHKGHEFKWGKVFKVLWSEPRGGGRGSESAGADSEWSVRRGRHGEVFYEKVRRFVIIEAREGHCICLPIMSYTGQGTLKNGVHASDHTIIYTEEPLPFPGEKEKGMRKKPIRMQPNNARHKLDKASRLNYAKLYTVEYNVKVWFIGKIHHDYERQLGLDYNVVHPPMPLRPLAAASDNTSAFSGAEMSYAAGYSGEASGSRNATVAYSASYPATSSSADASYYPVPATTAYSNVEVASWVPTAPSGSYQEEDYPPASNPTDPFYGSREGQYEKR